ncbi:MAG TPA: hypothetical protein VJP85_01440 [Candidatus Baltobacteraceae bacterium]|nr:hypothetical protein [Candidatus Baltobacteraceae bacterium]
MKRFVFASFAAVALFLCAHRPAGAVVEFCPASLQYERVGAQSENDSPGALYGFELSAQGPRTITSATLAFDTDEGWFSVVMPSVTLGLKDHHYANNWSSFTRHDWVTSVSYVRFPRDVAIRRAWVYQAQADKDGAFGWESLGMVSCPPPPDMSAAQQKRYRRPRVRTMHDAAYTLSNPDPLSAAPTAASVILAARTSTPLERTDCRVPFQDAEVRDQARPAFPDGMDGMLDRGMTSVEVALGPDGTLRDAWIWGPSGVDSYDYSALRAARTSTYSAARSYCMAVPSAYFFDVNFVPNSN